MQNEIINLGPLLDNNGNLIEKGFSKTMKRIYNRENVGVSKLKIKEWDYYLAYNNNYAVALTIADNGYMGMLSCSVIDLSIPKQQTKSIMTLLPLGKFKLPKTSVQGDIHYESKACNIHFRNTNGVRHLTLDMKNFDDKKPVFVDLMLENEPKESMVIATPFEKPKHFYYNQKIVGFSCSGRVIIGSDEISFDKTNTYALLDWGRGVWTRANTWFWGAGCGEYNGNTFGFNIGYGFGDTSNASENMLFYNGKAHKLDEISFNIPTKPDGTDDFLSQWTFSSTDGRFEMKFTPIIDRNYEINIGILASKQHQIFGKMTGVAKLDNGTKIELKDFVCMAEKVFNKW